MWENDPEISFYDEPKPYPLTNAICINKLREFRQTKESDRRTKRNDKKTEKPEEIKKEPDDFYDEAKPACVICSDVKILLTRIDDEYKRLQPGNSSRKSASASKAFRLPEIPTELPGLVPSRPKSSSEKSKQPVPSSSLQKSCPISGVNSPPSTNDENANVPTVADFSVSITPELAKTSCAAVTNFPLSSDGGNSAAKPSKKRIRRDENRPLKVEPKRQPETNNNEISPISSKKPKYPDQIKKKASDSQNKVVPIILKKIKDASDVEPFFEVQVKGNTEKTKSRPEPARTPDNEARADEIPKKVTKPKQLMLCDINFSTNDEPPRPSPKLEQTKKRTKSPEVSESRPKEADARVCGFENPESPTDQAHLQWNEEGKPKSVKAKVRVSSSYREKPSRPADAKSVSPPVTSDSGAKLRKDVKHDRFSERSPEELASKPSSSRDRIKSLSGIQKPKRNDLGRIRVPEKSLKRKLDPAPPSFSPKRQSLDQFKRFTIPKRALKSPKRCSAAQEAQRNEIDSPHTLNKDSKWVLPPGKKTFIPKLAARFETDPTNLEDFQPETLCTIRKFVKPPELFRQCTAKVTKVINQRNLLQTPVGRDFSTQPRFKNRDPFQQFVLTSEHNKPEYVDSKQCNSAQEKCHTEIRGEYDKCVPTFQARDDGEAMIKNCLALYTFRAHSPFGDQCNLKAKLREPCVKARAIANHPYVEYLRKIVTMRGKSHRLISLLEVKRRKLAEEFKQLVSFLGPLGLVLYKPLFIMTQLDEIQGSTRFFDPLLEFFPSDLVKHVTPPRPMLTAPPLLGPHSLEHRLAVALEPQEEEGPSTDPMTIEELEELLDDGSQEEEMNEEVELTPMFEPSSPIDEDLTQDSIGDSINGEDSMESPAPF